MGLEGLTLPVVVRRRDGWEIRLRYLVDGARKRPFEYGKHDCSTFAMLELPRALAGEDFRGRIGVEWTSESEAMALLDDRGLEFYVTQAFGPPVIGWKFGRRGDIGMVMPSAASGNMPLLGVILGGMAAVPAPDGLTFLRTDRLEKVWRLG